MGKSESIEVPRELVEWARRSAGLSLNAAAKKAGIKPDRLAQWEADGALATPRQLERLADALKRPVASFFLPAPPREPPLPVDFRLVRPEGGDEPFSFLTRLAIRRARRLQAVFGDLADAAGVAAPSRLGPASLDGNAEQAAATTREALGITPQQQATWKQPDVALKVWRGAVEARGVLVFQFEMDPREVSAFSLSNGSPAIVLNRKDAKRRMVFSLAHELGHVLLGRPGLCSVDEARAAPDEAIEVYCNAFAAGLLVPMRDFEQSSSFREFREGQIPLDTALEAGARRYCVSRAVVLRRYLTARAISADTYRKTAAVLARPSKAERKKGERRGPPPYTISLYELGAPFVRRVLAAHDREVIGDGEVVDYLGLRLKHLSKMHAIVQGG